MALNLYNSLTRSIEPFIPLDSESKTVGLYTCGPTVYDYVTVGNWRTYTLGDIVARVLAYDGYTVRYFMNITDVGHLTGDNSGDADTGEDRMEKAKTREGKTAWDIAKFYADDFKSGYRKLGLTQPEAFLPATEHISEQITLVQRLERAGLAYTISDGLYFDTAAYEAKGFSYGELSNLDQIKAGARVEFNPEKRNPRDFALWKFSPKDAKRDMEWESPWGTGFPGWHIECSAMSMQALGEQFDIHVGGEDLKSTHHPNEIAQSQGATGKSPFVKYWVHGAFLQVDGGRMGKSLGNAFNLHDFEKKGVDVIALRYFYFTGQYRSPLNFTWESIDAASRTLSRIREHFLALGNEDGIVHEQYKRMFADAIDNDLNMPGALAVLHSLLKDDAVSNADKRTTILDFDRVLGFGFSTLKPLVVPENVMAVVKEREEARKAKDWKRSDELRDHIASLGYIVKDTDNGPVITKK